MIKSGKIDTEENESVGTRPRKNSRGRNCALKNLIDSITIIAIVVGTLNPYHTVSLHYL